MKLFLASAALILLMSGCISRGYSNDSNGHNSGGGKCGMMMKDKPNKQKVV